MTLPYGNFMDFLTLAPGDWDHSAVKEEPQSPEEEPQEHRLHQSSNQRTLAPSSPMLGFPDLPLPPSTQAPDLSISSSSTDNADDGSTGTSGTHESDPAFDECLEKLMSINPTPLFQMTIQEQNEMCKILEPPRTTQQHQFPLNPLMIRSHIHYENGFSDEPVIREDIHVTRTMDFCFPQIFMNNHHQTTIPFQPPCEPFLLGSSASDFRQFTKRSLPLLANRFPALSNPVTIHRPATPPKTRRPRIKHSRKYGHILWKFILELLMNPVHRHVIRWTGKKLAFKIIDKVQLSRLWSQAKVRQNNVKISYESITRALRSYKPKPKETGKPAIISHSMDSNFTYFFNDYYRQEISEECKLSFEELLAYAKCASLEYK